MRNRESGLHTLCLLDIRMNEIDWSIVPSKGITAAKANRSTSFMTCQEAAKQILEIDIQQSSSSSLCDWLCVAALRVCNQTEQRFVMKTLWDMAQDFSLGGPLHSLIIVAPELHHVEQEMLELVNK
ncbi:hypothetical protein ACOME3_007649 [Neoechinorhynchus agilis]